MPAKFPIKKATQVVCRFLQQNGSRMNHIKLMKELYLAERHAIVEWGHPLLGDNYFSFDAGPILSSVLDLINSKGRSAENPYWNAYVSKREVNQIKSLGHCPDDELSEREIKLIDSISAKFRQQDEWDVVRYCHRHLKEWKDPQGTPETITIADILRSAGKNNKEIEDIEDEIKSIDYAKAILGC
ncbi:MAG: Panacea domain-containing protein [Candidatus Aureabacteria bacterium]|nr:Panacea domain-containing protein [Candidatus Auribacterota bacterium]